MRNKPLLAFSIFLIINSSTAEAQTVIDQPKVHMIYMGGNDCPPCVAWRGVDLPKLQQTEAFKSIKFSYVKKAIYSPVPSSFFLPSEVKPYKEKLDVAGAGRHGSPQFAIMVNDEVYDYYFGTRSAEDVERMLIAIRDKKMYPFKRCSKRIRTGGCEIGD